MMKKILLLVPLLTLMACGPRLEKVIEDTHPDGTVRLIVYYQTVDGFREKVKVEAFYENGTKRYEGEFSDDKRNGFWVYWYDNGNKWSEGYFSDDLRDGFGVAWHKNGQKHFEGSYDKGVRIGVWRFWDEDGLLVKEIDYDEGK